MFVIAIPLTFDSDLYTVYCGSVWHNESYIGMRFFAVLLLLFFYRKCNQYLNDFTVGDFFIECVLFLIVNWVKPNFTIAFAPAMLVMMIVDIIKAKGKGFVRWIMFVEKRRDIIFFGFRSADLCTFGFGVCHVSLYN